MESIRLSTWVAASPEAVWDAWMSGERHAAMTGGGPAHVEAGEGGAFDAWDGYIRGTHLKLDRARLFVQSWRAADFPEGASDSRLEVHLEAKDGGTQLDLEHSGLPDGTGARFEEGWQDFYFAPMLRYFAEAKAHAEPHPGPAKAKPRAAAKKAAKKPAKKAAKKAAKKPAKKAAKPAKKAAKKPAKKAAKKPAKQAAKPAKKAAKPAKKAAKPPAKKAPKR